MIIELEHPFKNEWRKGYLRVGKDGRKRVDLVNWPESRTTISYARYLLSVKEGRFLSENEEVDHIDGNNSNDDLENLQILTKEQHRFKSSLEKSGRTYIQCVCKYCGIMFERELREVKRYPNTFCTRSCSGKYKRECCGWEPKKKDVPAQDLHT
jgi:hypothetical protein